MSILGDGIVPAGGDGPEEDVDLLRYQRDRYMEDLERITAERDRYFAELEELHAEVERLRRAAASEEAAEAAEAGDEAPAEVDLAAERDELIAELERERDGYLEDVRRITAEFQNFRKQTERRNAEVAEHAKADLVAVLLPVLDACDAALAQGADQVEPIAKALRAALEKEGLEVIDPAGTAFDPNFHDAVMREEAEDPDAEPLVVETLRPGYAWRSRVVRPAMVKVRS